MGERSGSRPCLGDAGSGGLRPRPRTIPGRSRRPVRLMRAVLDTSVLTGAEGPSELEGGAISAASLAELHFGVLVAADDDERARRTQRLGVVEATFDPLPVDSTVAREWGRLAAAAVA